MDLTAGLDVPCAPDVVFAWVADLDRYPAWLSIVTRADRLPGEPPAWSVDLRARLGPLTRSKRLRMVRTELVPDRQARFERDEADGRRHPPWVLEAHVTPLAATGSRLDMRLHYGGMFWGPVLERLLTDEIERSRPRLLALVAS